MQITANFLAMVWRKWPRPGVWHRRKRLLYRSPTRDGVFPKIAGVAPHAAVDTARNAAPVRWGPTKDAAGSSLMLFTILDGWEIQHRASVVPALCPLPPWDTNPEIHSSLGLVGRPSRGRRFAAFPRFCGYQIECLIQSEMEGFKVLWM